MRKTPCKRCGGAATKDGARKTAKRIAKTLFTFGGDDTPAIRLVMEFAERRKLDGPGWCRGAVEDVIARYLCPPQRARRAGAKRRPRRQP